LGSCGHHNEPYRFIRGGIFLDKLSDFYISGVVLVDGLGGGPINFDSRDPRSVPSPERLLRPYNLFGRLQRPGLADGCLTWPFTRRALVFKARHTGCVALFMSF
jgi:hypothetical protein